MNEPRTLAAMVVNQIYDLHHCDKGSIMYQDTVKYVAEALDFYGQQCALQRQMDKLLIDETLQPVIIPGGNDTIN